MHSKIPSAIIPFSHFAIICSHTLQISNVSCMPITLCFQLTHSNRPEHMQSNIDLTTKNKKLHNQHSDHIESHRQYFWFLFLSQQDSCFSLSTARITGKLSCDLHICMCRCVGVCKCKWICLWSPEEGDGTPLYRRAGVTDSCESHYVGAGNWTKFSVRQVHTQKNAAISPKHCWVS